MIFQLSAQSFPILIQTSRKTFKNPFYCVVQGNGNRILQIDKVPYAVSQAFFHSVRLDC